MAKPGDVVEFKSGLFGIAAPRNLAIVLDRWRRKGVAMVRLATLEGLKEAKQEHLTRRAFKQRFDGDVTDADRALARLRQLAGQHAEGQLAEEAEDDLGKLEQALWEATCDGGRAWGEDEIASAHYGRPSPQQLRDAKAALDRCRKPGTGRFETAGRGDLWRPWTRDEVAAMRAAWQALQALRAKLVARGEAGFQGVPMDAAGLDEQDEATLAWVRAAMAQFVEHDGVPSKDIAGIGGTGAVQVFGMDLHRALGFLAQDWLGQHATQSSDYVMFLLGARLWTPEDAVAALTRRHVNQEPFFEHVPDERAAEVAARLPEPDLAQDPSRTDLRHLECYTIDPPDARDFDDAVGIETGDGTRLWVHIADVSHYVRPDTQLDAHAKKRATSVYLPGRVLPMLPSRLADHLCSLRSDGDRFALSVALDIDDGRVTGASFHASIIRVTENLAYADALARREAGDATFAALFDLAKRMRTQRRGPELDTGERRVLLEDTGFAAVEKRGDDATQMIETFMVAANEAVATHLAQHDVGLLYRCHPLPDGSKAERFRHQLATMGIDADLELPKAARPETSVLDRLRAGKMEFFGGMEPQTPSAPQEPGTFASLDDAQREAWLRPFRTIVDELARLDDRGLADVATLKLLACMGQAYYTPSNEGHFGLGLTHYCHFTSPIRRYPDLVVHRNLKWCLEGGHGEPPHPEESLASMSDHCSEQERAAAALERRVKSACLVLATLGTDSTGPARVTGITPASMFILRDDGIEARVPTRDLPGAPYHVDEWESMLFHEAQPGPDAWHDPELGEWRHVRWRLGDRVQARLAARHVAEGRCEARLAVN